MIGLWGVEVHSPQDIVTLTAALAGLAWVYVNVLKPCAQGLKHGVAIVAKAAKGLSVLDDLPPWMKKHDADRAVIESEVAKMHARVSKIENVQYALARELDIDVRADAGPDGVSESA